MQLSEANDAPLDEVSAVCLPPLGVSNETNPGFATCRAHFSRTFAANLFDQPVLLHLPLRRVD